MIPSVQKKSLGFTLLEMIVVIVILGVLAAAISSFVSLSTQVYTEAVAREKLVSSARFVVERLNRDVRGALPNSLRLIDSSQCLEFTPIAESTTYTDIPVAPELASNTIDVIEFNVAFDENWSVVVYPLSADDVYGSNDKVFAVSSISPSGSKRIITLENSVLFSEDSPTQRLYFINESEVVKYCLQNKSLFRNGVLMAQDIDNISPFELQPATLQRNAMVQIKLSFKKNSEIVTFNNEIQVLNVP